MRETEDNFDLANFFDEDNQDQIKVYKVLSNTVSAQGCFFIKKIYLERIAVDRQHNSVESL